MKTLLTVLTLMVSLSLYGAEETFKFDVQSLTNLAYSIKTNAVNAKTQAERDILVKRIESFVNQVRIMEPVTSPEVKAALRETLFQMGNSMELLRERSKAETQKLRDKIEGYTSDASILADYGLETSQLRSVTILDLRGDLRRMELEWKKYLGISNSLTGLTGLNPVSR